LDELFELLLDDEFEELLDELFELLFDDEFRDCATLMPSTFSTATGALASIA